MAEQFTGEVVQGLTFRAESLTPGTYVEASWEFESTDPDHPNRDREDGDSRHRVNDQGKVEFSHRYADLVCNAEGSIDLALDSDGVPGTIKVWIHATGSQDLPPLEGPDGPYVQVFPYPPEGMALTG